MSTEDSTLCRWKSIITLDVLGMAFVEAGAELIKRPAGKSIDVV